MKHSSKLLAAAAAVVALCSSQAHAGLIFAGSYNGLSNAYIGTYNSANADSALFSNGTLPLGAFTNTWVFNFTPGGSASTNANFIPGFPNPNSINNFNVALYSVTNAGVCGGNTLSTAGTCSTFGTATLTQVLASIPNTINSGNSSNIGFTPLVTGLYAIVVTGTVVATPTLYSGQLTTTPVPEPTSLALVGLALCGLGATLRKRKAA